VNIIVKPKSLIVVCVAGNCVHTIVADVNNATL